MSKKELMAILPTTVFYCLAFGVTAPVVSDVNVSESARHVVTITYQLSGGPAYVCVDVQTNVSEGVWASIGADNLDYVSGDANKIVESGTRKILWSAYKAWPDHIERNVRIRVDVRTREDPPAYLVLDTRKGAMTPVKYFTDETFIPGGLTNNPAYRTTHIPLKLIRSAGVEWAMGSGRHAKMYNSSSEQSHTVVMEKDFYIGVFEITQRQWANVYGDSVKAYFQVDGDMRPMESVTYADIRGAASVASAAYQYPAAPSPASFLGVLRERTGLAVDLPGDAQWEFAARGGHPACYWGNGKEFSFSSTKNWINQSDPNCNGRTQNLGGLTPLALENAALGERTNEWSTANGTAICGSYAPNDYGLYDMSGNVGEILLDWMQRDITGFHRGEINSDGNKLLSGEAPTLGHVYRDGHWGTDIGRSRSGRRVTGIGSQDALNYVGFRIALTVE